MNIIVNVHEATVVLIIVTGDKQTNVMQILNHFISMNMRKEARSGMGWWAPFLEGRLGGPAPSLLLQVGDGGIACEELRRPANDLALQ